MSDSVSPTSDSEHATVLREMLGAPLFDKSRAAIERAIEVLEAPQVPMEVVEVPDWRADADRLADALDHLMERCGRRWGPAVDALIAHEQLVEASP